MVVEGAGFHEPSVGSKPHVTIDTNLQLFVEDSIRLAMQRLQ